MQLSRAQEIAMREFSNGEALPIIGGPKAVSKGELHSRTAAALKDKGLVKINKKDNTAALTAKGKKVAASL